MPTKCGGDLKELQEYYDLGVSVTISNENAIIKKLDIV